MDCHVDFREHDDEKMIRECCSTMRNIDMDVKLTNRDTVLGGLLLDYEKKKGMPFYSLISIIIKHGYRASVQLQHPSFPNQLEELWTLFFGINRHCSFDF